MPQNTNVSESAHALHISTNPKNPEFRHELLTSWDVVGVRKADGDGRRECRTDAEAEGRRWVVTTAGRADTISALLEVGRYAASTSCDQTSKVGGCFTGS